MGTAGGTTRPPKPPPLSFRQDVAPKGGYPSIGIDRNVPKSINRMSALALLVGGAVTMGYGLYRVGSFNQQRRRLAQEKLDVRMAILPLLQAEEDAHFVKALEAQQSEVASTMANVPGWDASEPIYKTRKHMAPFSHTEGYMRTAPGE